MCRCTHQSSTQLSPTITRHLTFQKQSLYLHPLPSTRVTDVHGHAWYFIWVLGVQTQVLILACLLYQMSLLPSPSLSSFTHTRGGGNMCLIETNFCLLIYSGYLLFSIFIVTNLFIWQENETKQRNPLFKFLKADDTTTKKQVPSEEVSLKHHKLSLVPPCRRDANSYRAQKQDRVDNTS